MAFEVPSIAKTAMFKMLLLKTIKVPVIFSYIFCQFKLALFNFEYTFLLAITFPLSLNLTGMLEICSLIFQNVMLFSPTHYLNFSFSSFFFFSPTTF